MLVIPTMPIHAPFHPGVFYILDNLGSFCCVIVAYSPQLEAADSRHAQGDVGASQATQREDMFRFGLHLKNVRFESIYIFAVCGASLFS